MESLLPLLLLFVFARSSRGGGRVKIKAGADVSNLDPRMLPLIAAVVRGESRFGPAIITSGRRASSGTPSLHVGAGPLRALDFSNRELSEAQMIEQGDFVLAQLPPRTFDIVVHLPPGPKLREKTAAGTWIYRDPDKAAHLHGELDPK